MKRILLTQGKEALVSDQDYKYLMQWKWYYNSQPATGGYATRNKPRPGHGLIFMHKVVGKRKGLKGEIDHHDLNKLNNQRGNLRSATRSQNKGNCGKPITNKSGFKGVSEDKARGKWRARLKLNGREIFHERFPGTDAGKKIAALAYNKAAIKHFGTFAHLNKV